MATLGEEAGTLAREINTVETSQKIVNGTPQNIANTIWAMQQMKLACPEFVAEIIRDADRIMANGNPQHVSNIAYALADLGYFDKSLFVAVAGQAERITRHGTDQCLCNLLWTFAVAGRLKENEEAVKVLWREVNKRDEDRFSFEEWQQLKIASLFAGCEGVDLAKSEGHQQKMDEASLLSISGSSRFEDEIVKELKSFGFEGFTREVFPFPGDEGGELLKIDIAFEKERVALELDGPTHFLTTLVRRKKGDEKEKPKPIRDGPTKAKTRLMKKLGWQVSRHSYLNNRKLNTGSEEVRKNFWVKKLGKLGVEKTTTKT
ncbi:hypothetical protein TL16_g04735 [Triparma laevis f. inornata]|uniref:RAP domain-containing protein n=2 Tax=Triparma laevis TaxID=1534972 RepID=A0A9W7B7K4_9STRA|nr:hypothetical protein TL16_g04735 [Triparma laevis f. inornata]GMH81040.1 hypothetical protein TrLO_g8993 [Triparma laevis f. longispina]